MRNIRMTIAYDGTDFHGWQRQKNALTVQEVLEDTLETLTKVPTPVVGAGRTDAGVHALRYTCNFRTDCAIPAEKVPFALNALLPDGISVLDAQEVDFDFHSRFSAIGKHYRYRVLNTRYPDPFERNHAFFYPQELDLEKMRTAAKDLLGTHDFSAFCAAGATTKTSVRTVYRADLTREGDIITLDIYGNGFLYNMVRIIMGTLIYVGNGKLPVHCIPDLIAEQKRKESGITVPPQGLYFMEAYYDHESAPDFFRDFGSADCGFCAGAVAPTHQ